MGTDPVTGRDDTVEGNANTGVPTVDRRGTTPTFLRSPWLPTTSACGIMGITGGETPGA